MSRDAGRGADTASHDRADAGPVLLYDGVCVYCNGLVRLVLRHDRQGTLRFAALDSAYARALLTRHAGTATDDTAVMRVVRDGVEQLHVRSDAILAVTDYLGGAWRLAGIARVIPRPLRNWAYDAFARVRYRVFGRYEACPVPPPEVRARFLA